MTRKNEVRDSIYNFPDLHLLAESEDERDRNLYKRILTMPAQIRASSFGRKSSNILHEIAKKRIRGIPWKDIKFK